MGVVMDSMQQNVTTPLPPKGAKSTPALTVIEMAVTPEPETFIRRYDEDAATRTNAPRSALTQLILMGSATFIFCGCGILAFRVMYYRFRPKRCTSISALLITSGNHEVSTTDGSVEDLPLLA
jgi:hypothetical protein